MNRITAEKITKFWSQFLGKSYFNQDAGDLKLNAFASAWRFSKEPFTAEEVADFESKMIEMLLGKEKSLQLSTDYDPDDDFMDLLEQCAPVKVCGLLPIKSSLVWYADNDKVVAKIGYGGDWKEL